MKIISRNPNYLKYRYIFILCFIILLILSIIHVAMNMKFDMFDAEQAKAFWFTGETVRGVSLEKTSDEVKKIEKEIKKLPSHILESFQTLIGLNEYTQSEDSNFFTIIVYLTPANTRKEKAKDIVALLREKMKKMPAIKKFNFFIA